MPVIVINPVFPRRQWQDTSQGPNLLITHLGPGLAAFPLQYDLDVSNQLYRRDTTKGQVADPPNILISHPGPPFQTILNLDANAQAYHRESLKGQVADPTNNTVLLGLSAFTGSLIGNMVVNPVYGRRAIQDTTQPQNI